MLYKSFTSVAFLALATVSVADQLKFTRASQSPRNSGPLRRQDDEGYQPEDEACNGAGETCAAACGDGYEQCTSTDTSIHCFNPKAGETCCSTGSGSSCLAGFYCTHDSKTETWCCGQGKNLGECATEFGVTGALTSDIPRPTTTSTTSTSTAAPTTSSSEEDTTAAPTSTTTTTVSLSSTRSVSIVTPSRTTAAPSATTTPPNAAHANGPTAAFALVVAGFAVALL